MKHFLQFGVAYYLFVEVVLNKVTTVGEQRIENTVVLLVLVLAPGIDGIVELMAIDKIISVTLIKFALVNDFDLIEVVGFSEQFEQARITALGSGQMSCPRQSLQKERRRIFLFSLLLMFIKVNKYIN